MCVATARPIAQCKRLLLPTCCVCVCVLQQQDPQMANFMQSMNNPSYRTNIEEKLAELKEDPELADIMKEIEEGGPAAMTK